MSLVSGAPKYGQGGKSPGEQMSRNLQGLKGAISNGLHERAFDMRDANGNPIASDSYDPKNGAYGKNVWDLLFPEKQKPGAMLSKTVDGMAKPKAKRGQIG